MKKVIETYLKENKEFSEYDYIFKSRKGENSPITQQQAYRILNAASESLGLIERNENGVIISGEIGTHTLRKLLDIMLLKMEQPYSY